MDLLTKVLNLVKPNDSAISLDLSDAYMHITVFQKHRKFLRFFFVLPASAVPRQHQEHLQR